MHDTDARAWLQAAPASPAIGPPPIARNTDAPLPACRMPAGCRCLSFLAEDRAEARSMALAGDSDLQGRSACQPVMQ
jgi:hypothetical protein